MASSCNRDFGRVRPTQNENQPRQPKGLSANTNNGRETRAAQKRTVLGSITNNVRVQPSRAAKSAHDVVKTDGRQDENAGIPKKAFGGKPRNQPFTIYVDQDSDVLPPPQGHASAEDLEVDDDLENHMPSLSEAVMRLPSIPQPQVRVPEAKGPTYFLDMSGVEEEEEEDLVCDTDEDSNKDSENEIASAMAPSKAPHDPSDSADREAIIEEVPEYAEDIYSYLLTVENKHRPRPGFMRRQQDVTMGMRSILIDWLIEVAEEYKLQRETLFLTVNYIDRFLSQMSVQRCKLQLVGAAAMFLAAKYEEIYPPDVNEFVYITDDTYTKKQILRMEHLILRVLKFDVAMPTINWFAERLLRQTKAMENTKHFTMYICELVLVDYDKYLMFPSSLVAASALCLAHFTLDFIDCWPAQCESVSRYSLKQLTPCLRLLHEMHRNAQHHPQQSVREKYRLAKFGRVADVAPQPVLYVNV